VEGAFLQGHAFTIDLIERGKVQYTILKMYFEEERVAGFESKTLHFTVFEMNFLQGGPTQFDETEIATFKRAINKLIIFKIGGFKDTIPKGTGLVLAQRELLDFIKNLVGAVGFFHFVKLAYLRKIIHFYAQTYSL
jgi:hypothetical protein